MRKLTGEKESPEQNPLQLFEVTIIETLKHVVEIEAIDQQEAEQIVSDNWQKNECILAANNFLDVEFKVVSVVKSNNQEPDFEKINLEGDNFVGL